jgi:iron complex outermembrane receptor protein
MNYQKKIKEVGLAVALLAVTAGGARSENVAQLPEKNNKYEGKIQTSNDYKYELEKQAYATDVVGISKITDKFTSSKKRVLLPSIAKNQLLEKSAQKEFKNKVLKEAIAHQPSANNSNFLAITINRPQEDINSQPNGSEELSLLPPISENQKLTSRDYLLNTEAESQPNQEPQTNRLLRVNEVQQPLTTAAALYEPDIVITNISETVEIAQQIVRVINIEINETGEGIEIILETEGGEQLEVNPYTDGNALVAELPNAVLSLPDREEFITRNPIAGIAVVTARNIEANAIRVTIVGESNLPIGEIVPAPEGLTLSVRPVTEEIEVVVSATRTNTAEEDIPRSVTVIDREQIETQGNVSASNNVGDILGRLVPGFGPPTAITRRTRNQSLRGRPALILIDGVVQNSNLSNDTELNTIDPSAIERIEVIRGPSALYGSGATGGIVNIITRNPTEERLEQQFQVGISDFAVEDEFFPEDGASYNARYSLSGNQDNFSLRVDASVNKNNRFYDAEGDIIPTQDLDGTQSLNLLTVLGVDLNEDQRIKLKYNLYNDRVFSTIAADGENVEIPGLQKAGAERIPDYDYEEPPQQTNHNLSLTYNHDNLLGSELSTQFFFQDTSLRQTLQDFRDFFANTFGNSELPEDLPVIRQPAVDTQKLGGRLQMNIPLSESASVVWGVDYTNERNDTEELVLDPEALDAEEEARVIERVTSVPKFVINSVGVFAEGQWDASDRFLLSGGVRYENINAELEDWVGSPFSNFLGLLSGESLPEFEGGTNSASDVVFNAGVLYKASPEISLFFNFAQGFAIPSFVFLANVTDPVGVDVGTDDLLEPEKVNNYEIGVRGAWDSVQFSLAAFYNFSNKGQNLTLGADGFANLNRGRQRNYGVEATFDWQPADAWSLGTTFTWNEGEGDLPGDDRDWQPLSGLEVQPLKLTFYLENQTTPTWRNRLQMLLVGDRSRAFDEGVDRYQVTGYTTFDFISSLNLGSGSLELGIENLFNRQYIPVSSQERIENNEFRYLAAPGRNISLRYLLRF